MGNQLELLEAEVLKLPAGERAALSQLLVASLDEDAEIDAAWDEEIGRRIAEIDNGTAQLIPADEAFARVRRALETQ